MCDDPALVLHLTVLLLFQSVTQTMLQASGRFVSTILQFLTTHLSQDVNGCLQKYHGNLTFFCISCVLTLKITNLIYTNIFKVILQVGIFANAINFYIKISFRSAEQSGLIFSLVTILFCSQLHQSEPGTLMYIGLSITYWLVLSILCHIGYLFLVNVCPS